MPPRAGCGGDSKGYRDGEPGKRITASSEAPKSMHVALGKATGDMSTRMTCIAQDYLRSAVGFYCVNKYNELGSCAPIKMNETREAAVKTRQNEQRTWSMLPPALMVLSTVFRLSLLVYVVCDNVRCECNDGDAKPGEDVLEHGNLGEDWVSSPCLPFRPWVAIEWLLRH